MKQGVLTTTQGYIFEVIFFHTKSKVKLLLNL